MSEHKPLRLRKWRAHADVVEIQHTRDLRPLASEEEAVSRAVMAYVRALEIPPSDKGLREEVARLLVKHVREINRVIASGLHERDAIQAAVDELLALPALSLSDDQAQAMGTHIPLLVPAEAVTEMLDALRFYATADYTAYVCDEGSRAATVLKRLTPLSHAAEAGE